MKVISLLSAVFFSLSFSAQHLILYPFQRSGPVSVISRTKFDRLAITQGNYYRMAQQNKLPKFYFLTSDTIGAIDKTTLVSAPKEEHFCQMLAYQKKDSVVLIEICKDATNRSILKIKQHQDLTGDGINEVFVYYHYHHSYDNEMTTGRENLDYLEVWDPVKKLQILNLLMRNEGHSWSMCNGGSQQSGATDLYFYPGGFSVLSSYHSSSREDKNYSSQNLPEEYRYTPTGFVPDTVGSCRLQLKDRTNKQALLAEYRRLKSNKEGCAGRSGIFQCMRDLGFGIPNNSDSVQVIQAFGRPDKILHKLPPELNVNRYRFALPEGSQLWIYNISKGFYVFFVFSDHKKTLFNWYNDDMAVFQRD